MGKTFVGPPRYAGTASAGRMQNKGESARAVFAKVCAAKTLAFRRVQLLFSSFPRLPDASHHHSKHHTTRSPIMAIKVAINGFGRIGRLVFRALVEQGLLGHDVPGGWGGAGKQPPKQEKR